MRDELHYLQRVVNGVVASNANDAPLRECDALRMTQLAKDQKQTRQTRIHYIPEWAEQKGYIQADLTRITGADKSTVSRWFTGNVPQDHYLSRLAKLFEIEVGDLFLKPNDSWISQMIRGRTEDEKKRMRETLEFHFPVGSNK